MMDQMIDLVLEVVMIDCDISLNPPGRPGLYI